MKRYTVRYEQDERGWWIASVRGVKGCHTQGRSLKQTRTRIREALGLFIDDANTVELVDQIKLPKSITSLIDIIRERSTELRKLETEVRAARLSALDELVHHRKLSRRDAAELVGLSFQRVQQLVGR